MIVLLALPLPGWFSPVHLGDRICHRPELADADHAVVGLELAERQPDVLVTATVPGHQAMAGWRPRTGLAPIVVHAVASSAGPLDHAIRGPAPDQLGHAGARIVPVPNRPGSIDDLAHLLVLAERTWTDLASEMPASALSSPPSNRSARSNGVIGAGGPAGRTGGKVLVVGAGIVNLVTALDLLRAGFEVEVVDARPDPRAPSTWQAYGATMGGGNARMWTLTEADDHHDREIGAAHPRREIFDRPVAEGGWRIRPDHGLTPSEHDWLSDHRAVPFWLARSFESDHLALNRAAGLGWERLRTEEPHLFSTGVVRDRVLRLHSDRDHWRREVDRQRRVGALLAPLDPADVSERHPGLADACRDGAVAGGIEVRGFTLGVHDLVGAVLDELERGGARLHWYEQVEAIVRSAGAVGNGEGHAVGGEVVGIETTAGRLRSADHYVLSPGVYGNDLLAGTRSAGQIHGVLGLWITLGNPDPALLHSMKITRKDHIAEDANVTVGRTAEGEDVLVVGSGYGWTGSDPHAIDPAQLRALSAAVDDTAARYFPRAYAEASSSGRLHASRRLSVGPWTASGLGLFEVEPARGGGVLIVTGGHGPGGFAQAPVVADAVLAAVRGGSHPMHSRFHPARLHRVLGISRPARQPAARPAQQRRAAQALARQRVLSR
jgi:D-amino-acid dehydrogenase